MARKGRERNNTRGEVIGSAVVPTLIANAFYLPHHLLPETAEGEAEPEAVTVRSPPGRHD